MYKIMMVDDDPTSLAIGRALLEKDYQLVLMRSGVQALGYLKSGELPDLLLLDMAMPGISGIEVLKALKSDPALCEIPVVFLTGGSDITEEIESYREGAADFLQKPVNPQMLRIKLQQQFSWLETKKENIKMKAVLRQMHQQLEQALQNGEEI